MLLQNIIRIKEEREGCLIVFGAEIPGIVAKDFTNAANGSVYQTIITQITRSCGIIPPFFYYVRTII